jgi:hypothetical protein
MAKEGQTALTMRLDEVPLETTVELLADEAGLKAVRLSNVLYVTSEARAAKLRKSRPATPAPAPVPGWRVYPDGQGGFHLTPPNGAGIGGIPAGGIAGLGGGGFNNLGVGGGFAGIGGGAVQPVPLTPPLPKSKQPAETPKDKKTTKPEAKKALEAKLQRVVNFKGIDDPKTTLMEALDLLAHRYNLPLKINEKAFKFENVMDVGKTEIADPNPIAVQRSTLETVLRNILARIPVPSGATFVVREGHVEVTTGDFAKKENPDGVAPKEKTPTKQAEPVKPQAKARDSLVSKLARRVDFTGYKDHKTRLKDALDDLTKKYGVPFVLNEIGFKFENVMDVDNTRVADPNPVPPMKNARIDTILREILGRVPVHSGVTFMVRPDAIEITTGQFHDGEIFADAPEVPHSPVVQVEADKQPLDELLKSLTQQIAFNVLLDPRVGDKAKTPISAELYNVPLDTALLVLAATADLRVVRLDNVVFVTTPETAAALEKAKPKKPQSNVNYTWITSGPYGTLIRVPND